MTMIPNTNRVLIKPRKIEELRAAGLVIPGQVKPGENLLYGEIEHPGDTKFTKGQGVFYSEYSASGILDARALISGEKGLTELSKDPLVVVAEDDIMAFYDTTAVSEVTK